MGKIVILDENTANKIAAGEVIERPASVVKELVENSIDAGAGSISIEVKNGGISLIKISDNGSGIREDDAEIAFERHATSKIRSADDLEHVLTMGFRGEALASIAAVADVQVTTRVRESEHGTFVEVRGGHSIDVRQTGCPAGTTIAVRDLFFNTPARFKFLKKDSTEAGYISEAISRIAMGNPGISFKLLVGGSQVLYTPGNNDQLSAIFSIYGKDTAKNVYEVNHSNDKVKITGYIGKPEIARSNRSHQYIYINRRFIKSKIISSAVDEAYNTFLMKNKFPFMLLNIEINPMMVDVNVHPNKMEVKFSNEQDIFKAVYHAVNNALLGNSEFRQAAVNEKPVRNPFKMGNADIEPEEFAQQSIRFTGSSWNETSEKNVNHYSDSVNKSGNKLNNEHVKDADTKEYASAGISSLNRQPVPVVQNLTESPEKAEKHSVYYQNSEIIRAGTAKNIETTETKGITKTKGTADLEGSVAIADIAETDIAIETDVIIELTETEAITEIEKTENSSELVEPAETETEAIAAEKSVQQPIEITHEKRSLFEGAKIVGQIFSTYIILQQGEQMILIDQHAAHERIMYEELKWRFESLEPMAQMLLDTIVVELTHQELKLLEEEKVLFNRLGFEFEAFGSNSIILRAVPFSSLGHGAKEIFINTLDRMLGKAKAERLADTEQTLYTIACKAAVKANKKLDESEIKNILEQLDKLENPFTCPHGRPSAVRITKYEMEKMFKRIV